MRMADRSEVHAVPAQTGYGDQDENGVDLSLIRELLRLSPVDRVRRADRARRDTLRLLDYGRRQREKCA